MVDCRWDYEYNAGSIISAVNYTDGVQLRQDLVYDALNGTGPVDEDTEIVFYCEYSKVRAAKMSDYLRRAYQLYGGEGLGKVYLLDGGFNQFYGQFAGLTTGTYLTEKAMGYESLVLRYSHNERYDMNIPEGEECAQ
jgi:rhodanese-related sulfurtransferase